jgi:hypothetical protein
MTVQEKDAIDLIAQLVWAARLAIEGSELQDTDESALTSLIDEIYAKLEAITKEDVT